MNHPHRIDTAELLPRRESCVGIAHALAPQLLGEHLEVVGDFATQPLLA
jgi:hypothetical protein